MKKISAIFHLILASAVFCSAQTTPAPENAAFQNEGIASYYGEEFEGRPTASGELFNPKEFTAAHPSLPFGTVLTITNLANNNQVQVRINDRGPFVASRIIDVSKAAAEKLDMISTGTARVRIEMAPRSYIPISPELPIASGEGAPRQTQAAPTPQTLQAQQGAPQSAIAPPPQSAAVQQAAPRTAPQSAQQPITTRAPAPPPQGSSGTVARAQVLSGQNPQGQSAANLPPTAPRAPNPAYTPLAARPASPAPVYTPQAPRQNPTPAQPQSPGVQRIPPQSAPIQQPRQITQPSQPISPPPASAAASPRAPIVPMAPQTTAQSPASRAPSASAPVTQAPVTQAPVQAQLPPAKILGGPIIPGRVYRIQVGSYKDQSNAMKAYNKLTAAGFNPQWEPADSFYRIVLTGVKTEDIPVVAAKLGSAGFNEALARVEGVDSSY